MRPDVCADCPVRDQAVCSALNASELAELAAIGRHRDFARGETIFAADDDNVACATLVRGAVKLSRLDPEGIERIVGLVHPAGFLGQLFAATSRHEAIALTDSRICLFPRREFEGLMKAHPALTRSILERTLAELDSSRGLAELIGRRDVKARVAGLLLAFARAASPSPCGEARIFELPLSREEMASLLGTTIETVSRRLTALERDGILARHGARRLEILDPAALAEAAG
jgi:CRP/FNR family transcriptional regulator